MGASSTILSSNGTDPVWVQKIDVANTQLTAGRSLTLSTNDVALDSEIFTETITANLVASTTSSGLATTTAANPHVLSHTFPIPVTITNISCYADPLGSTAASSTIQIDERTQAAPNSAGTVVLFNTSATRSGLGCNSQGVTATTTFSNAGIAANVPVRFFTPTLGFTGAIPPVVHITITYTIDD